MRYINHDLKGTFGYIGKQRMFEIIKTVILFALALGIYFIAKHTLGTNKSLWSVIAVLGLIPASKSLVGVIMFARYSSLDNDSYKRYTDALGNIPVLFENVVTTSKKAYYLPIIACENNTLVTLLPNGKNEDLKIVSNHIDNVLKTGGHKGVSVKVFDKEDAFLKRLSEMNENLSDTKMVSTEAIFNTIKAVSL